MPRKTAEQLASEGLVLKVEIVERQEALTAINKSLIQKVGTEGARFQLDGGTVTVTSQTSDRPSGKMDLVFNKEAFLALDSNNPLRLAILGAGLVSFEEGVTAGRAPVVQYSVKD